MTGEFLGGYSEPVSKGYIQTKRAGKRTKRLINKLYFFDDKQEIIKNINEIIEVLNAS